MLTNTAREPLLDVSAKERESRLSVVLYSTIAAQKKLNLPMVYRNSLCKADNQFIHEYPNGKKYLIRQNLRNSEEKIIREL